MRLYYAACVCLLVAAAALRFHDLSEKSLRHDEAASANLSREAISEVIRGIRYHSSPILYPLVLHAVQKVESTPFSIRIVPAVASVLTVAALLFLLPRLGVAKGAAFLAALLATLSVGAIAHAQDAREYSIDALLAVLMMAGLLWHLRDGRRALLCVSLFLAPLVQYGLVLFGVAVMAAAMVHPSDRWQRRMKGLRQWAKPRMALTWPAACFLAGCATSYLVTVRHQWHNPDFAVDGPLQRHFFQGQFDARSIFEFSIDRIWSLLTHHLPPVVAMAALAAFAIVLAASILGKSQGTPQARAVLVVFSLCIAIAVAAAVLGLYPIGLMRHAIYLGPIVFLAVGVACHWAAGVLSSLTGREWTTPALLAAMGGAALAGVGDLREDSPYQASEDVKSALAVLKERVRKGDMVYFSHGTAPTARYYLMEGGKPPSYQYGTAGWCRRSLNACLHEMAELAYWLAYSRVWLVALDVRMAELESSMSRGAVKEVVSGRRPSLYLIEDAEILIDRHATVVVKDLEATLTRKPSIRSIFDVHLSENALIFVKEPCSAEDVQDWFFLHVDPVDVSDLPEHRKRHGFDGLDFRFNNRDGSWFRSAKRCVVLRALPDYDFVGIRTGQYNDEGVVWKGEVRFDEQPRQRPPDRGIEIGDGANGDHEALQIEAGSHLSDRESGASLGHGAAEGV